MKPHDSTDGLRMVPGFQFSLRESQTSQRQKYVSASNNVSHSQRRMVGFSVHDCLDIMALDLPSGSS